MGSSTFLPLQYFMRKLARSPAEMFPFHCSFWSYELSKRAWVREDDGHNEQAFKIMLCGGLAGVVTWASIFPLGTPSISALLCVTFADTR